MQAIGYMRVSTDEQNNSVEAQRAVLDRAAADRGWHLEHVEERASGKTLARRPRLQAALERLDAGKADALMVTRLDRLARSVKDFASIIERSRRKDWSLVVLDLGLDTSTPNGELAANVLMAVAQYERQLIGQRTREGLAAVKARGIQLGHPSTVPAKTRTLIQKLRSKGYTWQAVADEMNSRSVMAPSGRAEDRWHATSVKRHAERES
jgi:DNA invertase Pin-like site-specific DNA recombinase